MTDLCRIWIEQDGCCSLALVIDCHTRELLGWHLSRSGKSKTAEAALERLGHDNVVGDNKQLVRGAPPIAEKVLQPSHPRHLRDFEVH